MKILVVGSGGREHALAWCLARSPRVQHVIVAPGNGGTAREPGARNIPVTDPLTLAALAEREHVAFTVVGPEAPLAAGIVDIFRERGLKIFGPTRAAAQLESSKEFAKAFMKRHGIPTAAYEAFTDAAAAHAYIERRGAPIVIKADGLAAGKGVVVATDVGQAHAAVDMMLTEGGMGQAGARVVIEDFLEGEEASFIVMVDGRNVLALASSQDHKRLLDGDAGPNTGGMGAYSPAPVVTPSVHARVLREIIRPTVEGMAAEGTPFTGFLYAGLMIAPDGTIRTLEFNCRMGDPETQPILARIKSDFAAIVERGIEGRLDTAEITWDRRTALGVVLAAHGYPESPRRGDPIEGLPEHGNEVGDDCIVFHAGTSLEDGRVLTAGGRVLCVTALGDSVKMAQARAYEVAATIRFDGMQYRRDIGHRAIGRPVRK
ncbi:MAG: phosphoribosylamine--glycine ligase [Burkholderiaceae bacterium]|jgi:phosphoribosylamine--glycine ligase|nr:phosphoribosylamine--glycine ligase [Burkholderiaceae bacterium]MEB2319099.1 phosphoribosylamine--glycine ligase [Pseudomonadota bacterium]